MSRRKQRMFTDEQRAEVVELVRVSGKAAGQVAKELGIANSTVCRWVREARIREDPQAGPSSVSDDQAEILRLRKELARVEMERDFLKSCRLLRKGDISNFEMISAEEAKFPVKMMCHALEVSRSGFYAWKKRKPSKRERENGELRREIVNIHISSRRTYGSPRVQADLRSRGIRVSRKRIARLMARDADNTRSQRLEGRPGPSCSLGCRTRLPLGSWLSVRLTGSQDCPSGRRNLQQHESQRQLLGQCRCGEFLLDTQNRTCISNDLSHKKSRPYGYFRMDRSLLQSSTSPLNTRLRYPRRV